MTDYNVPSGQTTPVGQLNGNTGTITGNSNVAYGLGGGTLDVTSDWNGGSATVIGGTLEVDHDFNGTTASLNNATFILQNHDANGATINFQGVSRVFISAKIAATPSLENINFNGLGAGDRIELIGAATGGSGSPTFNNGVLSFTIGGQSYAVNASLAAGAPATFQYGLDSQSGYFYVGLAAPPPSVTITSPAESDSNATRTIAGTVTANGSATVAGTVVTLSEGGTTLATTTVGADGTFAASVTLVGQGTHDIVASDTDSLGSVGTSAAIAEVLTAAPVVAPSGPTTVPASGSTPGASASPDPASTTAAGSPAAPTTPAAASGTSSGANSDGAATDPQQVTPSASPLPDQTGSAPTADPSAAAQSSVAVTFDAHVSAHGSTARLTGTVSASGSSGVSVELFQGDVALGAATLGDDGTWSFNLAGDGTYQDGLHAVATDDAGATATAESSNNVLYTGTRFPGYDMVVDSTDPATGSYTGSTYFKRDGTVFLQTRYTALADGGSRVAGTGGSYFADKDFSSYSDTYDADGTLVKWVKSDADGSRSVNVTGDDQIVHLMGSDTVWAEGADTRFVYQPGAGNQTIYNFIASGAGHDTLSLPAAERGSLSQILQEAQSDGHGGTTLNLGGGGTIDVFGVGVDDLRANPADFRFRSQ